MTDDVKSEIEGNSETRSEFRSGEDMFLAHEGAFHLLADWEEPVFFHFRIKPELLQPFVPYELDLFDGYAYVSLVAFTMKRMRPAIGGWISELPFLPFRNQRFLNVRTYVKHEGKPGIHFIAEWISHWLCSKFGPLTYGLPYRFGRHDFQRNGDSLNGVVESPSGDLAFRYRGSMSARLACRVFGGSKYRVQPIW
jgi:uncharacterized protein